VSHSIKCNCILRWSIGRFSKFTSNLTLHPFDDDAPVGTRERRSCSTTFSCQTEGGSLCFKSYRPLIHSIIFCSRINRCRIPVFIHSTLSSHSISNLPSSLSTTPLREKLPRNDIQNGRNEGRDRCLWRGPGSSRQILGSTNGKVLGELQDQPASGPYASANRQGLWYLEGCSSDGEYAIWTWYAMEPHDRHGL
jgi:hypothetical protein